METNANDRLIWVDIFDNEIGQGEKMITHVEEHLHRAFSVFLVYDNKMFIQRRNLEKYHSGGLWANACCSHPRSGELLGDAIQRRMEDELGIPQGSCYPEELFGFTYYARYDGLSEYEYDHVFLSDYHGPIVPNADEMMDSKWIELDELQRQLQEHPENFSAWFLIAAPKVLAIIKNRTE